MKLDRNFFNRPECITALATFAFGLFVHMYGMVNILHNYDDISVQPQGLGTDLSSGRWFLYVLKILGYKTTGNFNLPWLNGIAFIILIAISAALLVSAFNIKHKLSAVLIGFGLVSFPSITSVLFFKYTAPAYGLSILFAVLAVWILEKWRYGFVFSALLLSMSVGIYQAYFPVAVAILLFLVIKLSLEKDSSIITVIKRGFYYLGTLIAGMVLYFILLKIFLSINDISLSNYQGVGNMGQLSLGELPALLMRAVQEFALLPINDYCNLATSPVLKLAYLTITIVSVCMIIVLIINNKKKIHEILASLALCALFPVAVNLIVIMCPTSEIYTLMVLAFSIVLCVPVVLLEMLETPKGTILKIKTYLKPFVVAVLSVIIFFNAYFANVNYTSMYYSNRQAENFFVSISTQIHMLEGYDVSKELAFIGRVDNKFFNEKAWARHHIYGGNKTVEHLINAYSNVKWIRNYLGHNVQSASAEEINMLKQLPEVQEMPSWPDNGSVKIIDNFVVVKLG